MTTIVTVPMIQENGENSPKYLENFQNGTVKATVIDFENLTFTLEISTGTQILNAMALISDPDVYILATDNPAYEPYISTPP